MDISGDIRATVKREDDPWTKPPAALDLSSLEVVYSGDGDRLKNVS